MDVVMRSLHGGCHCGRNSYIIEIPPGSKDVAQVLFNTDSLHSSPLATPLAAFLRVPLAWYQSTTHAFFADETHASIRRVFENPSPAERPSKRHFCGFCGTPLSFWTERPHSEASFIQLTLATLCDDDLRDLEDMGLLPRPEDISHENTKADAEASLSVPQVATSAATRVVRGVPWLDSLMAGSRLANIRQSQGAGQDSNGSTRIEWEFIEWTEGDEDEKAAGLGEVEMSGNSGKRKLVDLAD